MRLNEAVVQVAGHPVRYRVTGAGEPVVLVHGLAGSALWWTRTIPALAPRHRPYLVDLPGFGEMRRHPGGFVLAEAAAWLAMWMEAVGLRSADVVGHSMGGYIALRLAAQRPDLVRRLVLVAPAGVPPGRSITNYLGPLLTALRSLSPAFLALVLRDALRAGPVTLWRAARDLLAEDARLDFESVTIPTLLVWGEKDPLVPPTVGRLMREKIPNSQLVILPGAGHMPMFERPEELNRVLLDFLAGKPVGE
jgi:pimeloyl-ACP methyl ester carboxylesterase